MQTSPISFVARGTPMWFGGWKVKSVPANCVVRVVPFPRATKEIGDVYTQATPMWLGGWKVKSVPANCVVRIKSRKQRFSSTRNHKALLSLTFTTLFYLLSTKNAAEIRVLVSANFYKEVKNLCFRSSDVTTKCKQCILRTQTSQ